MIIYNYSPLTLEFIGQNEARPNPLENDKYLIPANATEITPPAITENQTAVFNPNLKIWEIKPDFRDKVFWNKQTKEKVIISEIGMIPDKSLTDIEPSENEVWKNDCWKIDIELWKTNFVRPKRNALLNDCLWMVDRHKQQKELLTANFVKRINLSDSQYMKLLRYIQELRDLPETINFENPAFPTKPDFLE